MGVGFRSLDERAFNSAGGGGWTMSVEGGGADFWGGGALPFLE